MKLNRGWKVGILSALSVVGVSTMMVVLHVNAQQQTSFSQSSSASTNQSCDSTNPAECDSGISIDYSTSQESNTSESNTSESNTSESNTSESNTSDGGSDGVQNESPETEPGTAGTLPPKNDTETPDEPNTSLQRPECPLPQKEGRTIVVFEDALIYANLDASYAVSKARPISLAPDTYAVTLVTWDGYNDRAKTVQTHEKLLVVFYEGTDEVARTNATSDLKDGVREASVTEEVNTALTITVPVTSVRAVHAAHPRSDSPHSLRPVCAAFDRHILKEEESEIEETEVPEEETDEVDDEVVTVPEEQTETNANEEEAQPTICATDRQRCADGSYVERVLPKCQFAQCPVVREPKPVIETRVEEPQDERVPRSIASDDSNERTAAREITPEEAQEILDRLQREQQSRPTTAVAPRAPTEREAEVIAERRQILERVPQETRSFNSAEREALVRSERTKRGEDASEVVVGRTPGSVLNSPIDDLEVLVEEEAGEPVILREPRRTVIETERTDSFELGVQRLAYRDRMDISVLRDSDGDGISDFDEVYLYETDPYHAYTAGGLLTDGERIELGLDPLSTSPARISVASPRATGEEVSLQYSVSNIELVPAASEEESETIRFRGLAPLNSLVTLVMFSDPIVVTVKANENGNWEYALSVPVEEGRHELYVTAVNGKGDIVTRSPTIPFVRTAEAVEFTPLSGATSQSGVLAGNFLPIALGSFLTIGLLLVLVLGFSHRRKSVTPLHGEDGI